MSEESKFPSIKTIEEIVEKVRLDYKQIFPLGGGLKMPHSLVNESLWRAIRSIEFRLDRIELVLKIKKK